MAVPILPDYLNQGVASSPAEEAKCQVPCDHIPMRSWPLFRARALLQAVIASFKAEQHP